jgi:hypothetical protein
LHRAAGFQFSEGKMKRLFFCIVLLVLAACSAQPSQDSIQTAIAQTQEANPTYTPLPPTETPTEIPTQTPTITPSPTPDLRVIDIDPYKLLLQKSECPPDGKYFLPGPDWTSPITNSEIVSGWTIEKGQAYLAETGRIEGWMVNYKRGNANVLLPQEIYDNVVLYSSISGAQIVIEKYEDRYVTDFGWLELNDPPKIGDITRTFVYKETDASGVTKVWYRLSFTYHNIFHGVNVYGYEKETSLDHAVSIAQTLLHNLEQLPLSGAVTFKP